MDFDYSPKTKELQAKLSRFMDDYIYPAEAENRERGEVFANRLKSGDTDRHLPRRRENRPEGDKVGPGGTGLASFDGGVDGGPHDKTRRRKTPYFHGRK